MHFIIKHLKSFWKQIAYILKTITEKLKMNVPYHSFYLLWQKMTWVFYVAPQLTV